MKRNLKQSLLALMLVFSILVTSISTSATETTGSDSSNELDTELTNEEDSTSGTNTSNTEENQTDNSTSNTTTDVNNTSALTQNATITTYATAATVSTAPAITVTNVDQVAGTATLTVTNVPSTATKVQIPIWNQSNQSDIIWYTATKSSDGTTYTLNFDISKHNFYLGTYTAHVYITPSSGSRYYSCGTTFSYADTTKSITTTQSSATSSTYTISASGIRIASGYTKLTFAVWSSANGQDDLKWYTATYNTTTNTWNATIDLTTHKTYGTYYVHAYTTSTSGAFSLAKTSSFTVNQDADADIAITRNNADGSFTITLSNIDAPAGVNTIQVPVWSTSNQSNIVWYTATKQSNGTYVVNSTINKHNNMIGTYSVHVYLTDSYGNRQFLTSSSMSFSSIKTSVSVTQNSSSSLLYSMKLTGSVLAEGSSYITYAVWSSENGQDDLKWYKGTEQGYALNTATLDLSNHKSYGTYYVHAYEVSDNGTFKLLTSTSFTVAKPSASSISVTSTNNSTGTFSIKISGISSQTGVSKVLVPVWSTSNQSNIVWYTATKQSDGSYTVDSSIFKHNNMVGTYYVHVYILDNYGIQTYVGSSSTKFTSLPISVSATDTSGTESTFTVKTTGSILAEGSSCITYAVWSATGGQDDLKWYTGSSSAYASNSATVSISNHQTTGTYYVHAYEVYTNGTTKLIGTSSFKVNSVPTASKITISDINNTTGTFKVTLSGISALSGVSSVRIPVWTTSNQSDIYWYTATKVSATEYYVIVDVANHDYNFGTFNIHAYVTMNNGISSCVKTTSQYYKPSNFLVATKIKDGYRTLILMNVSTSATSVQFPTWSSTNGQDDIIWYTGTKQDSTTWTATVTTTSHASSGTFYTHAYVNGSCVTSTSYTVAANEVQKNGWYYEGGYKLYYINGVLQTNLDGIYGKQSSYYIEVNRTLCTVTVYAKDGNNGYIIPVRVFACSVGLASTPTPTGTYTTSDKYRWHTLMGPSYGQYCTRITGGILFHSVAGYNMTSYNISASAYNMLGEPASHGCVRLTVADAKWIYDYCASGTTVKIFDSSTAGPFPKPATIKIPSTQNWDPTDPAI